MDMNLEEAERDHIGITAHCSELFGKVAVIDDWVHALRCSEMAGDLVIEWMMSFDEARRNGLDVIEAANYALAEWDIAA